MFARYAIFYTPVEPDFAAFGASWLGWDSAGGRHVPHPDLADLDVSELTETPRKYGFHATLKAPFRLADGVRENDLIAAADGFAAAHAPVTLEGLKLQFRHGFLALRPRGVESELRDLAGAVVRAFDPLRAPLSEADIARRRKARLSARQDAQMLQWGYPFVFEDFHFHMTLSGRLDDARAQQAMPILQALVTPVLPRPFELDAVTVMGEDGDGLFHQLHRATLAG